MPASTCALAFRFPASTKTRWLWLTPSSHATSCFVRRTRRTATLNTIRRGVTRVSRSVGRIRDIMHTPENRRLQVGPLHLESDAELSEIVQRDEHHQ